jgi:hypothetical protein
MAQGEDPEPQCQKRIKIKIKEKGEERESNSYFCPFLSFSPILLLFTQASGP